MLPELLVTPNYIIGREMCWATSWDVEVGNKVSVADLCPNKWEVGVWECKGNIAWSMFFYLVECLVVDWNRCMKSRLVCLFQWRNFYPVAFIICACNNTAQVLSIFVIGMQVKQNCDLCFCFKNFVKFSLNICYWSLLENYYSVDYWY